MPIEPLGERLHLLAIAGGTTDGELAAGTFLALGVFVLVGVVGEFTPDLWRWIKRTMKGDPNRGHHGGHKEADR